MGKLAVRTDYTLWALREADMSASPFTQFARWFRVALRTPGITEPNAMTLATVSRLGRPSARVVLLKSWDGDGFVFFTNVHSRKARDLAAHPAAALSFFWPTLQRQIHIEGKVRPVSSKLAARYFATRPRDSQISAWASPQSSRVPSRQFLDQRFARWERHFAGVLRIPPPPHWGGYRLVPQSLEFWQGRHGRLHDRLIYRRRPRGRWRLQRLGP